MGKLAVFLLIVLGLILLGCNSGPTDEEIAVAVEAQLGIALAKTAEAVPSDTAIPKASNTPVPTYTPIPTNTPKLTNTPQPTNTRRPTNTPRPTTAWTMGFPSPANSYFEEMYDEFENVTFYFPYVYEDAFMGRKSVLALSLGVKEGVVRPSLLWVVLYHGADWIYMKSIKIRIGDTTYDMSDRFESSDVKREVLLDEVNESVQFRFNQQDVRMLKSLLANPAGTIRLEGEDGQQDFQLTSETISSWFAALYLHRSFGGQMSH